MTDTAPTLPRPRPHHVALTVTDLDRAVAPDARPWTNPSVSVVVALQALLT